MIKYYRIKNKYTQEELARILNITLRHYQNIESYKSIPNVLTAIKLSKLLNANIEDIFNEKYYKSLISKQS
ncbi:MAG: helix-turn-helix transcriptional regulator [Caldisericum exile]|uniref:helix-turn-helix transcriptional regulator n=1 Tax=Caldisericum exile TaxID=693075 RepID=UPI003C75195D